MEYINSQTLKRVTVVHPHALQALTTRDASDLSLSVPNGYPNEDSTSPRSRTQPCKPIFRRRPTRTRKRNAQKVVYDDERVHVRRRIAGEL